jgi:cysteine-rich repeat protein
MKERSVFGAVALGIVIFTVFLTNFTLIVSAQSEFCGDGVINGLEECDDGGTLGGDGCDAVCMMEVGWVCAPMNPSPCFIETSNGQDCSLNSLGVTPLMDLGLNTYGGFEGGLYGDGSNIRPAPHTSEGLNLASQVLPLDLGGNVDMINGEIVMVSIGVSNTRQEFDTFIDQVNDALVNVTDGIDINPQLRVINLAQSGAGASAWAVPSSNAWNNALNDLPPDVSPEQVQIVWVKHASNVGSMQPTDFLDHATTMQAHMESAARNIKTFFPNAKLAYHSSRTRAYNTNQNAVNPELYAYEFGFPVRWMINKQISGNSTLAFNGPDTVAPWLSWGPYLWADGTNPRSDGFVWQCSDTDSNDGIHPSLSGRAKVAGLLMDYFTTDVTSTPWFLNSVCGDGVLDIGEQCDDGNMDSNDDCTYPQCSDAVCGDGIVWNSGSGSEQCDDGNTQTEVCSYGEISCNVCGSTCSFVSGATSYCGDSIIDGLNGEQCDDGNNINGDGCDSSCFDEGGPGVSEIGLIGYWKFEGDVLDSSGNGNDGTITGNPQFSSSGISGQALDMNTNDAVNLPSIVSGLSEVTTSVWIKASLANSGTYEIVDQTGSGADAMYIIRAPSERFRFRVYNDAQSRATSNSVPFADTEWHNVVGRYDGSEVTIFVDGISYTPAPLSGTIESNPGNILTIGSNEGSGSLLGLIDEMKIYDRALTDEEIMDLYINPGSVCGNGALESGEACDDGNTLSGDGCSSMCVIEFCGDGTVNNGEQCDDGNTITESCSYGEQSCTICDSSCNSVPGAISYCGDSYLDSINEACEIGDSQSCEPGNGYAGEQSCLEDCSAFGSCQAAEFCGDGVMNGQEECDDGGVVGGDGCSAVCTLEVCGNGIIEVGEQCDDGGSVDGDGCDSSCLIEAGWACSGQLIQP